jgi:hypothetical protein
VEINTGETAEHRVVGAVFFILIVATVQQEAQQRTV